MILKDKYRNRKIALKSGITLTAQFLADPKNRKTIEANKKEIEPYLVGNDDPVPAKEESPKEEKKSKTKK